jgi:cystathionine beta-lyase/cystathionine gamma-synthase
MRLETKLIRHGELEPKARGSVVTPIFQSATYESRPDEGYHDIRYMRLNNTPNHEVLHRRIAAIESGEDALVAGSGMAAISAAFLTLLAPGDHVLCHNRPYGGSMTLLTGDLARYGIETTFVDMSLPATWEKALRPRTKVMYLETITNPLVEVCDLEAAVAFARKRGLVSMIDNTIASPVNCRPIELGFDVVVHSATKYLNGHSDIVAGAVVSTRSRVAAIKRTLDHFGGSLDTHACFLLERGLKTLVLRVRHQNESTLRLAQALERHPAVARVHYSFLETHPHYARARKLLAGASGLLSFELKGGATAAEALIRSVKLATDAPSLGGPETLITRPAITSHSGIPREERERLGITDGLVRVTVGLEATDDLIEDFTRALGTLR